MIIKKLSILTFVCMVCVIVYNCAEQPEDNTGKTEISFWHVMGGPLGAVLNEMIEEFNQTYPGIHLTSVSMGSYAALSQKIMAAVAAGDPPVIAQCYESWTAQLIESKAIVPIEKFVNSEDGFTEEELSDFLPVLIKDSTWDGVLWSFPFNKSVPVYYYNQEMFEKVGLDPDRFPTNWSEFLSVAKKLTTDTDNDGKIDQWGTAFPVSAWMFENLLLQNDGNILSTDGSRAVFNDTKGVEALSFLVDQIFTHKVAYLTTGFEHQNDFLSQKVGMIQGSIASYSYMQPQFTFKIKLAPLPAKERKAIIVAGTNIVIFSNATPAQQQAAWKFIKWFTSTENTTKWAIGTFYVPLRKSALRSPAMQEHFDKIPGLKEVYEQLEHAEFEPRTTQWMEGRKYLEEKAIESALRGKLTPKAALDLAAEKINKELM